MRKEEARMELQLSDNDNDKDINKKANYSISHRLAASTLFCIGINKRTYPPSSIPTSTHTHTQAHTHKCKQVDS